MRRLFSILRVVALVAGGLAIVGLLLFQLVLPGFVEDRIRAALADAGLPAAELRVRGITLRGADLAGLRLDPEGRISAESILVDFDVDSLLDGRVETVTVTGAVLHLIVRDGELDLGPLADLKSGEGGGGPLPFDRLRLASCLLRVDLDDERIELPVAGEIVPDGEDLDVSLRTRWMERDFALSGRYSPAVRTGRAEVALTGRTGERFRLIVVPEGPVGDGNLTADFQLRAAAFDRVLFGHRVVARGLDLRGRATVRGFREIATAKIDLAAGELGFDGQRVREVKASLEPGETGHRLTVALARGGDRARATADLPHLDVARLRREGAAVRFSLEAGGPLPPEALPPLAGAGVAVAPETTIELAADATVTLVPDRPSPTVEIVRATVGLSGGLAHPASGFTARDLRADLSLSATASVDRIDLRVVEGSRVSLAPRLRGVLDRGQPLLSARITEETRIEIDRESGKWAVDRGPTARAGRGVEAPAGAAAVSGLSGRLVISGSGSRDSWSVRIDSGGVITAERAQVAGHDISGLSFGLPSDAEVWRTEDGPAFRAPEVRVEGAARDLGQGGFTLALEGVGRRLTGRVLPGSEVRAGSFAAAGWRVEPAVLTVPEERAPTFKVSFAGPLAATAAGAVVLGAPARVEGPSANADLSFVRISGAVEVRDGKLLGAAGTAELEVARVSVPSAEIEVGGVTGVLPVGMGDETSLARIVRKGSLRADSLSWRGEDLPPPEIELSREGAEMGFGVRWPITDAAMLTAEGRGRLAAAGPEVRASVRLPRFALAEGGRIAEALRAATGFSATGEIEASGKVELARGRIVPAVDVRVFDAALVSADGKTELSGVSGAARIVDLSPIRTRGGEKLTFERARVGDLTVTDGSMRFAVESPRSILVERAEWLLGETGRFWIYSFRLDPKVPDVDVELFCEDLSLSEWLSVVSLENAEGSGTLYGKLRLRIRTKPRLQVTLGEGFLHSEGNGSITVRDTETVRKLLEKNLPQMDLETDVSGEIQSRIVKALQNFDFDALTFDMVRRDGSLVLTAHVAGKGREPPHQGLDLTVNLNGFEELIGPALAAKLKLDETKAGLLKKLRLSSD